MNTGSRPLSRREFLGRTAALAGYAATAGLGSAAGADAVATPAVIDTHIHLYDPGKPGGVPWPPPSNAELYSPHLPDRFAELSRKLGVVGVIVVEANADPADNEWVLELGAGSPLILGYVARLFPGQPDFGPNFEKYAKNPLFTGLRLSQRMLEEGLGKAAFEKDVLRVAEHGLTLDLVGGLPILPAAIRLARLAPKLRLVLDHLPFPSWDGAPAELRAALRDVGQVPQVFAKISTVLRRQQGKLVLEPGFYRPGLDALLEIFGEDRVLYGSNWPVSDLTAPYDQVFQVVRDYFGTRSTAAAEKFFWRNSQTAYRWKPRGEATRLVTR